MKVTLEFDTDENNSEFIAAINGMNFWCVLWDIDQQLRLWDREKKPRPFNNVDECLEKVRELLYDSMEKYNVNIDMID
jgi:hypothetical protein